ncbi:MAG: type II toxin-antitoxin system VapC family toxin [Nanoarchaeota archaeon]|jgi:predicted nucleic acid-binding protein|nr:type II toxin-antitoxin system VapC family toxin [Nanoarchaeota archaeon]
MIGLDTCALIDLLRGEERLVFLMNGLNEEFCLCQASYLELSFGINPNIKFHLEEESFYDDLFKMFKVVEMNNELLKKSSRLFWKMKSLGMEVGKMDSVIAASFISAGVNKIITKDRHFEKIKGLKVLSY